LIRLAAANLDTAMGDPAMRLVSVIEDDRIVVAIPQHMRRAVGASEAVMTYTVNDGVVRTSFMGMEEMLFSFDEISTLSRSADGAECRGHLALPAEADVDVSTDHLPPPVNNRTRRDADGTVEVTGTVGEVRF
jgi:hypothetical protein